MRGACSLIILSFGHCAGVESNVAKLENTDQILNQMETRIEDLEDLHSKLNTQYPTDSYFVYVLEMEYG